MSDIKLDYDVTAKKGTLTFANGRRMTLAGVTLEQAQAFHKRHAEEFAKRDCVLHTVGPAKESADD